MLEDITPEGSVVPVYLDESPLEPGGVADVDVEDEAAERAAVLEAATAKLAKLGLSPDEVRAIAGGTS